MVPVKSVSPKFAAVSAEADDPIGATTINASIIAIELLSRRFFFIRFYPNDNDTCHTFKPFRKNKTNPQTAQDKNKIGTKVQIPARHMLISRITLKCNLGY